MQHPYRSDWIAELILSANRVRVAVPDTTSILAKKTIMCAVTCNENGCGQMIEFFLLQISALSDSFLEKGDQQYVVLRKKRSE